MEAMRWFTCGAAFATRIKGEEHRCALIEERLYLVAAPDGHDAERRATDLARREEQTGYELEFEGRPAREQLLGIRKTISVRPHIAALDPSDDRSLDGAELSYSYFRLKDDKDLQRFLDGDDVDVTYVE